MKNVSHQLTRTLFIDIETVSQFSKMEHLSENMQKFWQKKAQFIHNPEQLTSEKLYEEKAAIYAEFGKIVCISVGAYFWKGGELKFKTKSFSGFKEEHLLLDFAKLLNRSFSGKNQFLCGHNIKEFDVPYICRRMLVHGIPLPSMIDVGGRKPWELKHILDTMNQWKFGDYKHYTSLSLLCELFQIQSPKDSMSGADVGKVFWKSGDLERIQKYCESDVQATANLFRKLNQMNYQSTRKSKLHKAS